MTDAELRKLAYFLEKLPGETINVMEYTGSYWQLIAKVLYDAGFFLCSKCTVALHSSTLEEQVVSRLESY